MSRIIIPKKSAALTKDFFHRRADVVARDLLGRILVHERARSGGLVYAQIREVAAYEGEVKTMCEGAKSSPGTLSVSRKCGQNLLDIATNGTGVPSCITFVAADIYDRRGIARGYVSGPGNLTKALDIAEEYNCIPLAISPIWIAGEPTEQLILQRNLSGLPENCRGYFYYRPLKSA